MTLWDLATRKPQHTIKCESINNALAFSPDGRVLAVGTSLPDEEAVRLYDTATGKLKNDPGTATFRPWLFRRMGSSWRWPVTSTTSSWWTPPQERKWPS